MEIEKGGVFVVQKRELAKADGTAWDFCPVEAALSANKEELTGFSGRWTSIFLYLKLFYRDKNYLQCRVLFFFFFCIDI